MHKLPLLTLVLGLTLGACSGDVDPTAEQPDAEMTEESTDDTATDDAATDDAAAAAGGSVTFVGTDGVAWESDSHSTAPGSNDLTLECGTSVPHGLAVEGVQDGAELAACGETATVELEAGDYTYFCTVPGHREAGMEGTLTVG